MKNRFGKKKLTFVILLFILIFLLIIYLLYSYLDRTIIEEFREVEEIENKSKSSLIVADKNLYLIDLPGYNTELELENQYILQNTLEINKNEKIQLIEYYYEFDPIFFDETAIHSGLDDFSFIEEEGKYLWFKSSEPDFSKQKSSILFELENGFVTFKFEGGVSVSNTENSIIDPYIDFMFELFKFEIMESEFTFELLPNLPDGLRSYKAFYKGKPILSTFGDEVLISFYTDTNKITDGFFYIIPLIPELEKKEYEVTPIKNITNENAIELRKKFIYTDFNRNNTGRQIALDNLPLSSKMLGYKNSYISYYNYRLGIFQLIPVLDIHGSYTDTKNNIGNFRLIVINSLD